MAQNKVADESTIVEKKKVESTNEEMISKVISETTSKVLSELMPYLQNNTNQTPQQIQQTTKEVKERVVRELNGEYERVINENRKFMTRLAQAPKTEYKTVRIPQVYRKYFGSQLVVGLNGSFVTVPVDGRPHRVHKDFYSLIQQKLDYEDSKISHMEQTGFNDVLETSRENLGN